jgi:polysaccharide deacetylase 2 family uncharacterized protein YibQ
MERKKRAAGGSSRKKGRASHKRKAFNLKRFRANLILIAAIFGVSAGIFFIRFGVMRQNPAHPASILPATEEKSPQAVGTPSSAGNDAEPTSGAERAPEDATVASEETDIAPAPQSAPARQVSSSQGSTPLTQSPLPGPEKILAARQPPVKTPIIKAPGDKAPTPKATPEKAPVRVLPPRATVGLTPAAPPPERPFPVKHRGTVIFIFDDAGYNLKQLEPFLKLPFPCTIAVLPGLEYSREAARRVRAAGKEAILHQPMQAINLSLDPGPGAITQGMSPDQIKATVRKNLAEVGPVSGLNNHEGSLITADRKAMEAVLAVTREKGIYFLDSRTNAATQAPAIAREMKMTIWERAVFLDNAQDRESIEEAVTGGLKIAEKKGAAIMIGHVWSADLADVLREMYPELVSQGYSLSTIARIATEKDIEE